MKNYTNDEIKKIALEKYSKDYEMLQGQINWFIKGFREALSQHDVSICTCGTEEYSENEPRVDGMTYCGKCDKPY